jgi:hypothetical protein
MNPQHHIIGRTVLEIDSDRVDEMWSFQHDISDLFQQKAVPAMEQLFDQLVGADEVVRLDQVVVQLDPVDRYFLADDFVRNLLDALHRTLNDHLATRLPMAIQEEVMGRDRPETHAELSGTLVAEPIRRDRTEADWEVLLYFLQYGRLPWWCPVQDWQSWISRWEAVMQEGSHWQAPLRELLMASPSSRQRLVAQFSEGFRHQMVLQLQPTWLQWSTLLAQARQLIQALHLSDRASQHLQTQAWLLLLSELGQAGSSNRPLPALPWTAAWLALLLEIGAVEGLPPSRQVIGSEDLEGSPQPRLPRTLSTDRGIAASRGADTQSEEEVRKRAIAHSYLRSLLESMTLAEPSLWLAALDRVMPRPSTTLPPNSPPQPSAPDELEDHREQAGSARDLDTTTPSPDVDSTAIHEDVEWASSPAEQPQLVVPTHTSTVSLGAGDSPLSPEEGVTGLFVNQAGLVILHPFLLPYFEAVGLLDGEVFRDEAAQQTAIYLLHYLATRQTDAPEYELVLPKLLCGWPLNEPVRREPALPDAALTEAEHLLQTVIDYWEVLKSTSPDGLREGFLQRGGKLTQLFEGDWRLQVEQQAIDVLLSRLPWGFNVVKLPWMESMIMVEWI